jgi:hypothetical protein
MVPQEAVAMRAYFRFPLLVKAMLIGKMMKE